MPNPFLRRTPNKKRKEPRRVIGRERLHTREEKEERRRELYERSRGQCENLIEHSVGFEVLVTRCSNRITWESMHWSHNRHAANKDDCLEAGLATCANCHLVLKHNPKSCKRRPGKVMRIKDAQEYWSGVVCFCEGEKKARESFCATCRAKLSPQVAHDLENADDPDTYRETLALAENEILMWRPE